MTRQLRGAVLAGGMSRRFGHDKARTEIGGVALLTRALLTVGSVLPDPVILVNETQRYEDFPYERVADFFPGSGPLGGIHAGLSRLNAEAVLVLTCDMPGVTPELLYALAEAWRPGDAGVFADAGAGIAPFPGIYAKPLLPLILRRLNGGERCVRELLAEARGVRMIQGRDFSDDFFNLNTPADFAAFSRVHNMGGSYVDAGTDGIGGDFRDCGVVVRRQKAAGTGPGAGQGNQEFQGRAVR